MYWAQTLMESSPGRDDGHAAGGNLREHAVAAPRGVEVEVVLGVGGSILGHSEGRTPTCGA